MHKDPATIGFCSANKLKLAKIMVTQKTYTTRNGIGIEFPVCENRAKRVCASSVLIRECHHVPRRYETTHARV
jgi:hypothetical protein